MGKVLQSVKEVMQGTLHLRKPDIMMSPQANGNGTHLNAAVEEFEKIFVDRIGRLKVAIIDDQTVAAIEAQQDEQVIESLKANIAALEAKLKATEETVHGENVTSQQMEERLNAEIRDLQSAVKKKEEALESRDAEINDLKSKRDVLVEQVSHLELANQQAKGEAASKAQQAEQIIESLKAQIEQLTRTEQIVGGTDRPINAPEQNHDRQAIDLNAELEPQTNGIKEAFSFFSRAEALADIQAQDDIDTVAAVRQSKTAAEKPTTSFQAAEATPILKKSVRETVSKDLFDRIIAEFSKLTNVIGGIASLIIRDHVRVLGESMEEFPKTRLTQLLESLSREISDDKLKADFRRRFGKE